MIIGKEKCPCGQQVCKRWMLTGIGTWYMGTGFEEDQIDIVVEALNDPKYNKRLFPK